MIFVLQIQRLNEDDTKVLKNQLRLKFCQESEEFVARIQPSSQILSFLRVRREAPSSLPENEV
jgi:hypothetical protein